MTDYKIDTTKPVLVTGATGYVAGVLIKELLEEGVTVHATVRDPSKTDRFEHLTKLADASNGTIKFFKGDLLTPGSFEDAMKGCSIVFHTASPFALNVKNPQEDLINPAVDGTKNVLQTATSTPSVKRVVLTSSIMAMFTDCADIKSMPNGVMDESCWNATASLDYQPYPLSKTKAEQAAWIEAGSQNQWTLVVINPGFVMGPATKYHSTSESWETFKLLVDGSFASGVANFGVGVVDVRDVSRAHIAAAYSPKANGRNLCVGVNTTFLEMSQTLYEKYGQDYGIGHTKLHWLIPYLFGPYLPVPITRKYIYNNIETPFKSDNSKIKKELGIEFRSLKETMNDMMEQFIAFDVVKPKGDKKAAA